MSSKRKQSQISTSTNRTILRLGQRYKVGSKNDSSILIGGIFPHTATLRPVRYKSGASCVLIEYTHSSVMVAVFKCGSSVMHMPDSLKLGDMNNRVKVGRHGSYGVDSQLSLNLEHPAVFKLLATNVAETRNNEISREHATITTQETKNGTYEVSVMDHASKNGVFVNGLRVRECQLRHQDVSFVPLVMFTLDLYQVTFGAGVRQPNGQGDVEIGDPHPSCFINNHMWMYQVFVGTYEEYARQYGRVPKPSKPGQLHFHNGPIIDVEEGERLRIPVDTQTTLCITIPSQNDHSLALLVRRTDEHDSRASQMRAIADEITARTVDIRALIQEKNEHEITIKEEDPNGPVNPDVVSKLVQTLRMIGKHEQQIAALRSQDTISVEVRRTTTTVTSCLPPRQWRQIPSLGNKLVYYTGHIASTVPPLQQPVDPVQEDKTVQTTIETKTYVVADGYRDGIGVTPNYAEAVRRYRLGVEKGDAYAQFNLGNCYRRGQGVYIDRQHAMEEAIRLYTLSAKQGNEMAQKALKEIVGRTSS